MLDALIKIKNVNEQDSSATRTRSSLGSETQANTEPKNPNAFRNVCKPRGALVCGLRDALGGRD